MNAEACFMPKCLFKWIIFANNSGQIVKDHDNFRNYVLRSGLIGMLYLIIVLPIELVYYFC